MKHTVNVGIPEELRDRVVKRLKYGDSINSFVRKAVEEKLKRLGGHGMRLHDT